MSYHKQRNVYTQCLYTVIWGKYKDPERLYRVWNIRRYCRVTPQIIFMTLWTVFLFSTDCGNATVSTNSKQVDLRHSRGVNMFYFSGLSFRDTRGSEFFRGLSFRDIQGSEFFGSEFSRHPRVWVFSGSEFSRHPRVWVFRVWGLSFRGLSFRDMVLDSVLFKETVDVDSQVRCYLSSFNRF